MIAISALQTYSGELREDIRPAVTSLYLLIQAQTQLSLVFSRQHINGLLIFEETPQISRLLKQQELSGKNTGVDSFASWVNVPSLQDAI